MAKAHVECGWCKVICPDARGWCHSGEYEFCPAYIAYHREKILSREIEEMEEEFALPRTPTTITSGDTD